MLRTNRQTDRLTNRLTRKSPTPTDRVGVGKYKGKSRLEDVRYGLYRTVHALLVAAVLNLVHSFSEETYLEAHAGRQRHGLAQSCHDVTRKSY